MKRLHETPLLRVLVGFLVASILTTPLARRAAAEGVSDQRIARLARGINIPNWFWLNRGRVRELDTCYPEADLQLIKKLGFTHVRVPIDMANVYDKDQASLLNQENLPFLDRGIKKDPVARTGDYH